MLTAKQPSDLKQCVLAASDHLNKAALLATLLKEMSAHVQSLLDTISRKTRELVKRLDIQT